MDASLLVIQPALPEPIYRQIVAQVERLVVSGRLQPGERMPSVRDIAAHHAINPMTVSRAYSQLESEGVLARERGRGMVVAERPRTQASSDQRLARIEPQLRELARQVHELDLPARGVLQRLRQILEDE